MVVIGPLASCIVSLRLVAPQATRHTTVHVVKKSLLLGRIALNHPPVLKTGGITHIVVNYTQLPLPAYYMPRYSHYVARLRQRLVCITAVADHQMHTDILGSRIMSCHPSRSRQ